MFPSSKRHFPLLLCLIGLGALACVQASAQDPTPAASPSPVTPPGVVRGHLAVEDSLFSGVMIKPDPDSDKVAVDSDTLLFALDYWLEPNRVGWVKTQVKDGMIALGVLRTIGISGRYDPAKNEILVNVPEYLRRNWPVEKWFRGDVGEGAAPPTGMMGPPPPPQGKPLATPSGSDTLFEKVFKKKKPVAAAVQVPLIVGGESGPEITVHPGPDPIHFQIEAAPVLQQLGGWLGTERIDALRAKVTDGKISLAALREAGLKAEFDELKLRMLIDVPLETQKLRVRSLIGRGDEDNSDAIKPPFASGYLNVNASEEADHGSVAGSSYNTNFLNTSLDGVVNLGSVVLEGQAFYNQQLTSSPWQRGDVNVTKDFPEYMMRTTVGDLNLPAWGYERAVPMGGVGAATEFSTRPNVNVTALSHHEIELKMPSTVNIYRNGALIQTLQLKEGHYDLRDIPAISGANDITLEVIDPSGRKETINLSQYFFAGFLAPGLQQFSYDVGFPWLQDGAHRDYDTTRPVVFLSDRVGITTELTAGAFLQKDPDQSVAGGEAVFPLLWGVMQADAAASRSVFAPGDGLGGAVRAYYSYLGKSGIAAHGSRSFGLGIEYHSPSFYQYGLESAIQPFSWDVFGNYTEPVSAKVSVSFGASYSIERNVPPGSDVAYRVDTSLNRTFDRGTSGTLTLAYNNAPGSVEGEVAIYFNWAFPEKQQLIRASYDSLPDRTSLSWDQNSNSTVGSLASHAELDRDDSGRTITGQLDYLGNRGEVVLREDLNDSPVPGGSDAVVSRTRVTAAGALVFAGPVVTLSRTVLDSFVVVKEGPAQRGQVIEVNPIGNGEYFAQTDWLGPASLAPVSSYQKYRVHLGDAEFTGDASLPSNYYNVLPTYKSGVLISLATGFDVVMRGRLRGPQGKPLARISGEIAELSPPSGAAAIDVPFFTNRAGLFQIENLRPGKYEFRFYDETWKNTGVEIPNGATGLTDIGTIDVTTRDAPKGTP